MHNREKGAVVGFRGGVSSTVLPGPVPHQIKVSSGMFGGLDCSDPGGRGSQLFLNSPG